MHTIRAQLALGGSGPEVVNLQDALNLLPDCGVIRSLDPPDGSSEEELAEPGRLLVGERAHSSYGEATRQFVQIVQLQHALGDNNPMSESP
jgi:hypothetical protein